MLSGPLGSDPIGDSPGVVAGTVPTQVYTAVSRVIGSVQLLARLVTRDARVSVSRVIGSVKILTGAALAARVAVSRVIGAVRLRGSVLGSPWTEPWTPPGAESGSEFGGLPCPTLEGYQYQNAPGLVRTEMESGVIRQRKRWGLSVRPALARVVLTGAQLVQMEAVFVAAGAAWWNLPMVTGSSDGAVAMHSVRLSGPVQVRALAADVFEVLLPLEIQ